MAARLLPFERALHEVAEALAGGFAFAEDGGHVAGDGALDFEAGGEVHGCVGGLIRDPTMDPVRSLGGVQPVTT